MKRNIYSNLFFNACFLLMAAIFTSCNNQTGGDMPANVVSPELSSVYRANVSLSKQGNSYSSEIPWREYRTAVDWDGSSPFENGVFYHINNVKNKKYARGFFAKNPDMLDIVEKMPSEPPSGGNKGILGQTTEPRLIEVNFFPSNWTKREIYEYIEHESKGTIAYNLLDLLKEREAEKGLQLASDRFEAYGTIEVVSVQVINFVAFCHTDNACQSIKRTSCSVTNHLSYSDKDNWVAQDTTSDGSAPQFMYAAQWSFSHCIGANYVTITAMSQGCNHEDYDYDSDYCW